MGFSAAASEPISSGLVFVIREEISPDFGAALLDAAAFRLRARRPNNPMTRRMPATKTATSSPATAPILRRLLWLVIKTAVANVGEGFARLSVDEASVEAGLD